MARMSWPAIVPAPLKNAHEGNGHHHGHEHGEVDPHAWQRMANVKVYAKNIAESLCSADAAGCAQYRKNEQVYQAKLDSLDKSIRASWASVPAAQRKVITSHDAFAYYAKEYQVGFRAAQGINTAAEAPPRGLHSWSAKSRRGTSRPCSSRASPIPA